MPQAGNARVAYRVEDGFLDPDTEADWKQPGVNISVNDLSIDNELERVRQPDDATPIGSREGNVLLQASVEFVLTDDNWAVDLLPLDGGTLSGSGRVVPTAEWVFEVEYLDADTTIDDETVTLAGAAVQEATVSYSDGEFVSVELTLIGGGLSGNAPSAGGIIQPDDDDVFTQHSVDISVGGRDAEVIQSATLSLNNLAERSEQQERTPRAMVTGAIEAEWETEAVFAEPDQLELATGDTTASIGDMIDGESSAEYHFENGLSDTVEFDLTDVQPANYEWSGLVDPEDELTEPITWHVADVEVVGST